MKVSEKGCSIVKLVMSEEQPFSVVKDAAAKSLQSCLTLCDPIDGSPPESQGWGSLVGCCLWGHTESDTTKET